MLVQVAEHVAKLEGKRLGEALNITLHGQEKNLGMGHRQDELAAARATRCAN